MSNGLDLDQAQHFLGPDLGPNCLHRYSEDNIRRHGVKAAIMIEADNKLYKIFLDFQV